MGSTSKNQGRSGEFLYHGKCTSDLALMVILIVEDEPFILNMLVWVLEDMGHDVLAATDLAGALAHLAAAPTIDMLFVDIRLAALACGGYDVADQAIGLRPHLAVIYTSGSVLTPDMTGRFVPGGRFLQKPYSPDQVEASIAAVLG
jgi:CheY-like chemotaxis protein